MNDDRYWSIQRARRFRLLHLRYEWGQWAWIITPWAGMTLGTDKPCFRGVERPTTTTPLGG
jgi:hypothetical protein